MEMKKEINPNGVETITLRVVDYDNLIYTNKKLKDDVNRLLDIESQFEVFKDKVDRLSEELKIFKNLKKQSEFLDEMIGSEVIGMIKHRGCLKIYLDNNNVIQVESTAFEDNDLSVEIIKEDIEND